jgi:hypothetical protein
VTKPITEALEAVRNAQQDEVARFLLAPLNPAVCRRAQAALKSKSKILRHSRLWE